MFRYVIECSSFSNLKDTHRVVVRPDFYHESTRIQLVEHEVAVIPFSHAEYHFMTERAKKKCDEGVHEPGYD